MKKLLVMMMALVMALCFAGCGSSGGGEEEQRDSLGDVTFVVPEGYYDMPHITSDLLRYRSEGEDLMLYIDYVDEEILKDWAEEGEPAMSVEEYFNLMCEGREMTEIAGCEGYIDKMPEADGNIYYCSAGFMLGDREYSVTMDANAYNEEVMEENSPNEIAIGSDIYDEEGNVRDGSKPLTEDNIAVFDSFIESIELK